MMKTQLKNLANRHEKALGEMQARQASEFKNKEDEFSKKIMELECKQDVEIKDSIKADEDQLSDALQIQARELTYSRSRAQGSTRTTSAELSPRQCGGWSHLH
jgi:t-SNARE complex subunit (syntaxin)